MATPNYSVDYNDERFQNVTTEQNAQLSQMNNAYNEMINSSDQFYQSQIGAIEDYKNTQMQNQQANTDFAIEQINQQKAQAEKDYTKEQKGAYVDWQKQSNQYGANAEAMAAQGLTNTGFSESSQVSMFNTYQNRVSVARDSFNRTIQNFDNSITQAQLANNSALAEIAYNALQKSLEIGLEGFQYKNNLILDKLNKNQEINNEYYNRWQNVQSQINTENALAEEVRQYNESMALEREQMQEQKRQYEQDYALKNKQYQEDIRQFNEQIAYYKAKDAEENKLKIQQLEEQKRQAQQAQANWEKEYQLQVKQLNASLAKAKSSGSSGSSAKLTNNNAKLDNNSKLEDKPKTTTTKTSSQYNTVLNTARTTYNASKGKTGSGFAEEYLAIAVSKGQITLEESEKIAKQIGIKK
jgi:hypothetical protein